MTDRPLALPHAVYHLYGPADLILYIGITRNVRARFAVHKHKSGDSWWLWVKRWDIAWCANYREAKAVETAELREHRPPCNPIIPEGDGKHVTTPDGRNPVRSLWDRLTTLAHSRDETMTALVIRALENEEYRLLREDRR